MPSALTGISCNAAAAAASCIEAILGRAAGFNYNDGSIGGPRSLSDLASRQLTGTEGPLVTARSITPTFLLPSSLSFL